MSLICDINPLCVAKQAGVGLAQAAFGGILHSIASGITDIVGTLLNEVMMSSNGAAQVKGSSFTSLYGAMLVPAMVLSVIVLIIAVTTAAIQGRSGEIAKRALLVPLGVFLIVGAAAALVNDALDLVSFIDGSYIQAALGAGGFKAAFGQMGFNATGNLQLLNTAAEIPNAVFQIFIGIFLLIATFAIWVEMQVRTLAIWILVAVVPLASAGLFWSGTQRWLKRLIEALVAAILTPIPITIVLSIGAKLGMGTDSLSKLMLAFVTMMLAAFSLPMLLKLVPLAEMMAVSGIAAAGMGHAGTTAKSAVGSATKDAPNAVKRLAGPVGGGASGVASGLGAAAGTVATGGLAVAAKAAGFAKNRLTGSVEGKSASATDAAPETAQVGAHVPPPSSRTDPADPAGTTKTGGGGGPGGGPGGGGAPAPPPANDPAQAGGAGMEGHGEGGAHGGGVPVPPPAPKTDPGTTPSSGPTPSAKPRPPSAKKGTGSSSVPDATSSPTTGSSTVADAKTTGSPATLSRTDAPSKGASGTTGEKSAPRLFATSEGRVPRSDHSAPASSSPAPPRPPAAAPSAATSSDGLSSPGVRPVRNSHPEQPAAGATTIPNFDPHDLEHGPHSSPSSPPAPGEPSSSSTGSHTDTPSSDPSGKEPAPRLFDVGQGRVPRTHYGPAPSKAPRQEPDPPPEPPRPVGG